MKRFLALCLFWPMIAVVIVMAGITALLRLSDRGISALSDWLVPAVLALAEVADRETKD